MTDTEVPSTTRMPRLNLFAFPADTDFRFALLIIAVLGASLYLLGEVVFDMQAASIAEFGHWFTRCSMQAERAAPFDGTLANMMRFNQVYSPCMAPLEQSRALRLAGGLVALIAMAGVLFLLMPRWLMWRRRYTELKASDAPGVFDCLDELCREAGLTRRPTFVWNVLDARSDAQAFGYAGRPMVGLSGGLITRFYDDQAAFRAVLRHELAHLANRDVNKTYFALSVWYAFILVVLVPYGIGVTRWILASPDPMNIGSIGACLFLALLVLLTRNTLLHTREAYADTRAAFWDGSEGALRRIIAEEPTNTRNRWHLLHAHPSTTDRLRDLDNSDRLLPPNFASAFGTGVVATVSFATIAGWLNDLLGYGTWLAAFVLAALLCIAPAGAAVSVALWRSRFAAEVWCRQPARLSRVALGLALGIAVGDLAAIQNGSTALAFASNPSFGMMGLFVVLAGMASIPSFPLLLLLLYLYLRWVDVGASSWLGAERRSASPLRAILAGVIVSGIVLAVVYGPLIQFFPLLAFIPFMIAVDPLAMLALVLNGLTVQPIVLLMLSALWVYPLAARLRGTPASTARWAFVGDTERSLPSLVPLEPGRAAWAGLRAGLTFCAILLATRVTLRLAVREAALTDTFKLWLFYSSLAASIGLQAFVAYWCATKTARLSAIHGLFAAWITGAVASVGFLAINLALGGEIGWGFAWPTFSQTVAGGALVAIPLAVLGEVRVARRRRHGESLPALRPSSVG